MSTGKSGGEQLRFDILKGLEFQGVAAGIEKKHGGLFARLPLEADVGLDDEFDVVFAQSIREGLPAVHSKDDAEMRDGDAVTIDGIHVSRDAALRADVRVQMTDDLVAEEVEIDPGLVTATFTAAKQSTIKGSGFSDITDLKREMKRSEWHRRPRLLECERMRVSEIILVYRECTDKEDCAEVMWMEKTSLFFRCCTMLFDFCDHFVFMFERPVEIISELIGLLTDRNRCEVTYSHGYNPTVEITLIIK